MVGQREVCGVSQVLDESRLKKIVENALGAGWSPKSCKLRSAAEGLTGFLGDHFRAILTAVDRDGETATLHLFVKSLPLVNQAKADFIVTNNFARREQLMFQLFEELGGDKGPNKWRPAAYLYSESVLVMPDLAQAGYAPKHFLATLDLPHVKLVAESVARFHAAFVDHATKKTMGTLRPYNILEEHPDVLREPTLCDSPWVRAAAKLSATLLNVFSAKYNNTISDLEPKILNLYLEACDSLREYSGTVNVTIHRDLWMNNIMFGKDNAILVDYQCVRYAPPAFDLMILLYLTTTREFRDAHEKEVMQHYFSLFYKSVNATSKRRLDEMGYHEEEFLRWCESSRMFGLFYAISIFPYVLMEPRAAAAAFDDPATYDQHTHVDRSRPVLQHARACRPYLDRQLQATEEFVDRYLLKKLP